MTNDQPISSPSASFIPSGTDVADIRRRINRPVVLVGMMGVGKSTVGKKLAALLQLPFFDADDEIEAAAQLSISEIFDQFGESYFRDGERRVIARLMDKGPAVVATGGGAFIQDETRELVLEKSVSIWLDSDEETLVERVTRKDTRPLLRGGNPRDIVSRLKQEREPYYRKAALHVVSDSGPHQHTVLKILEALNTWL